MYIENGLCISTIYGTYITQYCMHGTAHINTNRKERINVPRIYRPAQVAEILTERLGRPISINRIRQVRLFQASKDNFIGTPWTSSMTIYYEEDIEKLENLLRLPEKEQTSRVVKTIIEGEIAEGKDKPIAA